MRALALAGLFAVVPGAAWAYGVPSEGGSPNHWERLLHVFTNQVRQAPHAWPGWDTSLATPDPRPPLAHHEGLLAAARYHADDMARAGCFSHESCDGTPFQTRAGRYFSGPAGENIYTSTGDDQAASAMTGWMNSAGHRMNILEPSWTHLGTGFGARSRQIYYVQNFGLVRRAEIPPIPGGAVARQSGDRLRLLANYWDPAGSAPRSLEAVVDGTPRPMTPISGRAGNDTWELVVDGGEGCRKVYFEAVTASGDRAAYPSRGALLAGATCASEYQTARPEPPGGPVIIDADEDRGGCRCAEPRGAGGLALLFGLGLLVARRRR